MSTWNNLFLFTIICFLILIIIYIIIILIANIKYYSHKNNLQEYTYNVLKTLPSSMNYDFENDPLSIQKMNQQLINELCLNLLNSYDQNYTTYCNTINNITNKYESTSPSSCIYQLPVFSKFQKENENELICFFTNIFDNIPHYVLRQTAFFIRYLYMILLTSNNIPILIDFLENKNFVEMMMDLSISPSFYNNSI